MAFTFGFYNSVNGDRNYTTEQISSLFDGLITEGIFASIGDAFMTVPGEGMQVLVKSGKAWLHHTWNINDSVMLLDIEPADVTRGRYDAVVIEVDARKESRTNSIKVIKGIASANPVKPNMENSGGIYQYPIAYISVPASTEFITTALIEIVVGQSPCPFVTGIVDSVDITNLFNQWNGEFDQWFENLQEQLSGSVAGNLQRQIDDLNKTKQSIGKLENKKYNLSNLFANKVLDLTKAPLIIPSDGIGSYLVVGDYLLIGNGSTLLDSSSKIRTVSLLTGEEVLPLTDAPYIYKPAYLSNSKVIVAGADTTSNSSSKGKRLLNVTTGKTATVSATTDGGYYHDFAVCYSDGINIYLSASLQSSYQNAIRIADVETLTIRSVPTINFTSGTYLAPGTGLVGGKFFCNYNYGAVCNNTTVTIQYFDTQLETIIHKNITFPFSPAKAILLADINAMLFYTRTTPVVDVAIVDLDSFNITKTSTVEAAVFSADSGILGSVGNGKYFFKSPVSNSKFYPGILDASELKFELSTIPVSSNTSVYADIIYEDDIAYYPRDNRYGGIFKDSLSPFCTRLIPGMNNIYPTVNQTILYPYYLNVGSSNTSSSLSGAMGLGAIAVVLLNYPNKANPKTVIRPNTTDSVFVFRTMEEFLSSMYTLNGIQLEV